MDGSRRRDWNCALRVAQKFTKPPEHIAIRAHHIRVHSAQNVALENSENMFPCWLAAMTETPFRVTLDLRVGALAAAAGDFQLQAEVFKQEWEVVSEFTAALDGGARCGPAVSFAGLKSRTGFSLFALCDLT